MTTVTYLDLRHPHGVDPYGVEWWWLYFGDRSIAVYKRPRWRLPDDTDGRYLIQAVGLDGRHIGTRITDRPQSVRRAIRDLAQMKPTGELQEATR